MQFSRGKNFPDRENSGCKSPWTGAVMTLRASKEAAVAKGEGKKRGQQSIKVKSYK